MATLTIPYPDFVAGTTIVSAQVDANNDAIIDYINDRDTGAATWTAVYVSSSAANPVQVTGSAATTEVSINNTATDGDPILSFKLSGTASFVAGVDDSDSDKFKIAHAATLGTAATDDLIISSTTGAVAIRGTATNDNGATGFVGEYVSTAISLTNYPSSTQWGDAGSISLTAGDWDVTGTLDVFLNGATTTANNIGISTTSGNSSSGLVSGDNSFHGRVPTTASNGAAFAPLYRVSLSATTTYYLKVNATYSVGTPQYRGRFSARRVR